MNKLKKILVIDDDMTFGAMMKAAFDPKKYVISSVANGEEGLREMEEYKPDIILLDIMMPKMDGIEFLRQINEKYGKGKTPVIITSNISSIEKVSEGVELGVNGYIIKSDESLKGIIEMVDGILKK